jgi:ATP-dependent protease ClpP protease subunit
MKEKELEFKFVADYNAGGKSTMCLFSGLDHEGLVAESFISEFKYLEQNSSEIEIKINSSGGSVMSGLNIVSTILDSDTPTTSRIVGVAASMASVIALATDKTIIADYGLLMVHNPFSPSGSAENAQLEAFAGMLRTIYSTRLGLDEDGVKAFMDGEEGEDGTWFNAEKAFEAGLVTEIEKTDIQKKLEDELEEGAHIVSEEIVNELQMIAAELVIEENIQLDAENGTAVVEAATIEESVPENLINNNMSLENISASLGIKDATVEAIDAKVSEILADNASLEETIAAKNEELVAANKNVSEKEIELATVSAELETAKSEKVEVEAKVEGLEAKISEFEAAAAEAHAAKIDSLVNDAADAGKIANEAKDTWKGLLEASFESASAALEGLVSNGAEKVKLSDKVSAEVETKEEIVEKVEEEVVASLPTISDINSGNINA